MRYFLIAVFLLVACGEDKKKETVRLPHEDFTLSSCKHDNGVFYKEEHSFHDYMGKVVILDLSTVWCVACKKEASERNEYTKYLGVDQDRFQFITILVGATLPDACMWSMIFNLGEEPVLVDPDYEVYSRFETGFVPTNVIFSRDLHEAVITVGWPNDAIEEYIKYFDEQDL